MQHKPEFESRSELLLKLGSIVNRNLNSGMEYTSILNEVYNLLDSNVPFDRLSIGLIEGDFVALKWVKSKNAVKHLSLGYRAPLKGSSLQTIAASRQPRIINDLLKYFADHSTSESTKKVLSDGILSSLTFPLCGDGKVVGFLFFSSASIDTYKQEHVAFCANIADELSMLVNYGKLHKFFETYKESDRLMRTTLHELRSPLSIIQGYLALAKSEDWYQRLNENSRGLFEVLHRNSDAMFALISDLEKANVGGSDEEQQNDFKSISLPEFCAEISNAATMLCEAKQIDFHTVISPSIPAKWVFDERKIKQVLHNLVSNAIKFSYPRSLVTFSVVAGDDGLRFSIRDTGQGIPQSELSKLFTYFGKTSVRPTAGEGSSGLGLAIAEKIVESHGSGIKVESTFGVGSTFSFVLPNRRTKS